jgi:signal transduction histidine kinase
MNGGGRRPAEVAHDLRTPLNAIEAWTHVLESHLGTASPEALRALEGIREGVRQQAQLIDELVEQPPRGTR